ncbi:CPBP family intramembrane metalloprotease [Candidatus Bipolaricaulota bacterium]|nr:CPBP family intramembrane metalloprotease [Candidatus Bipolaricaulota bacterium]
MTSILFGLAHGPRFSGVIQLDWFPFSMTFVVGFILAWMTLKTISILVPIVTHNLFKFQHSLRGC